MAPKSGAAPCPSERSGGGQQIASYDRQFVRSPRCDDEDNPRYFALRSPRVISASANNFCSPFIGFLPFVGRKA